MIDGDRRSEAPARDRLQPSLTEYARTKSPAALLDAYRAVGGSIDETKKISDEGDRLAELGEVFGVVNRVIPETQLPPDIDREPEQVVAEIKKRTANLRTASKGFDSGKEPDRHLAFVDLLSLTELVLLHSKRCGLNVKPDFLNGIIRDILLKLYKVPVVVETTPPAKRVETAPQRVELDPKKLKNFKGALQKVSGIKDSNTVFVQQVSHLPNSLADRPVITNHYESKGGGVGHGVYSRFEGGIRRYLAFDAKPAERRGVAQGLLFGLSLVEPKHGILSRLSNLAGVNEGDLRGATLNMITSVSIKLETPMTDTQRSAFDKTVGVLGTMLQDPDTYRLLTEVFTARLNKSTDVSDPRLKVLNLIAELMTNASVRKNLGIDAQDVR